MMQDTFRAEWAWQILRAPERISGMVQSMLQDYKEGGWLPMWKNIVGTLLATQNPWHSSTSCCFYLSETNIMVGHHCTVTSHRI